MLSVARSIVASPTLLIADELSLGLAPLLVDSVFEGLTRAREAGVTVIIIEQYVHRALEFADECLVLQRGEVAWQGEAQRVGEEVLRHYLGESMTTIPVKDAVARVTRVPSGEQLALNHVQQHSRSGREIMHQRKTTGSFLRPGCVRVLLISAGCSSNSSNNTTTSGSGGGTKTYTLGLLTDLPDRGLRSSARRLTA